MVQITLDAALAERLHRLAEAGGPAEPPDASGPLSRQVTPVANQLRHVAGPLEQGRRTDAQAAELPHWHVRRAPQRRRPPRSRLQQALRPRHELIEAIVDVAVFQQLQVGELDDLQRLRDALLV